MATLPSEIEFATVMCFLNETDALKALYRNISHRFKVGVKFMESVIRTFESLLLSSRYLVVLAVICSLLASFVAFYMSFIDAIQILFLVDDFAASITDVHKNHDIQLELITQIIELLDGFLLAIMMLIFATGLYELFVRKIEHKKQNADGLLIIASMDELKARLGQVVIMILIVQLFEHSVTLPYESPIEIVYLACSTALIGLALFLSHASGGNHKSDNEKHGS